MPDTVVAPHFVEHIQATVWYLVAFVVLVTCIAIVSHRYGPPNE